MHPVYLLLKPVHILSDFHVHQALIESVLLCLFKIQNDFNFFRIWFKNQTILGKPNDFTLKTKRFPKNQTILLRKPNDFRKTKRFCFSIYDIKNQTIFLQSKKQARKQIPGLPLHYLFFVYYFYFYPVFFIYILIYFFFNIVIHFLVVIRAYYV